MQISYAGYDFDGQPGNVFAHAFIFDDVDENFLPERYIGHKRYRTHLTEKDLNGQIVHYLKPLDNIAPSEGVIGIHCTSEQVCTVIGSCFNSIFGREITKPLQTV